MLKSRVVIAAVAALAFLLPSIARGGDAHPNYVRPNKAFLSAIKRGVGGILKDPYSAVYEDIWGVKEKNGDYVFCGYVNAKNSFGAYIGLKMFAGTIMFGKNKNPYFVIDGIEGKGVSGYIINSYCARRGVLFD